MPEARPGAAKLAMARLSSDQRPSIGCSLCGDRWPEPSVSTPVIGREGLLRGPGFGRQLAVHQGCMAVWRALGYRVRQLWVRSSLLAPDRRSGASAHARRDLSTDTVLSLVLAT